MIVVDTNIIAYFLIPGDRTELAETVRSKDSVWAAPLLWRSEMRSLLALYLRKSRFDIAEAKAFMADAITLVSGKEFYVESDRVLELADRSKCSAYDCEFVSLAEDLNCQLVTSDKQILAAFPKLAVSMESFVR